MATLNHTQVLELIRLAIREDVGAGDITTQLLSNQHEAAQFRLMAKRAGVFAGREVAAQVLRAYDDTIELEWCGSAVDGLEISAGPAALAIVRGPVGTVLTAERVLLNVLQRLCGVATLTRAYVKAIERTGAAIYDTRKTVPGWRTLDKYAVRCGGGCNHRDGLYDAILIKDNHLAGTPADRLAPAVFEMLNRLEAEGPVPAFVEVEAESPAAFKELLKVVGLDVILLDNFSIEDLREAVALRNELGLRDKIELEASGGITLETVRAVAETGVERISVGAITHSAVALDLSLERL